ncbi:MAG: non-ribosomal peptide synthetase, partial [Chitinophagaceae bacterium]
LYKPETVERMVKHFQELLSSIAGDPKQTIGNLSMLTSAEENQLLVAFNNKIVSYPRDKTVVNLFEEQVSKTPDSMAVVFEKEQLTYQQLNERANQLAHYLLSKGVTVEALVPICIERSAEMIIGILGILKAGAAYVPIDPAYPEERISFMLRDSEATIVVSNKQGRVHIPSHINIISLDSDLAAISTQSVSNPQTSLSAHNLAYVIYTSGSTGKPKGVMISHGNLVDYIFGLDKNIQISECRSYALVSSIATDLGNTVLYSSLLLGGALHLFSKEAVNNADGLQRYFRDEEIECVKIVPSHWKALCTHDLLLPSKMLIFGGEALQAGLVEEIRESGTKCKIINHYGPTETTIGKLLHVVKDDGENNDVTVPIGKPFSNTEIYIVNRDLSLCPLGIPGELCIGGDGVARGYRNNTELTASKFIANPFRQKGSLLYRTGDLVKYLPDGNIEFIGRIDEQVKIHGYRVELGEIENVLLQSGLVHGAAVLSREDKSGNKQLVGYVLTEGYFDRDTVIDYLKNKLPEYMVPMIWVELESFPLLSNGKIDRKVLPDPDAVTGSGDTYMEPRNGIEIKLVEIWQKLLEVERIGIRDNFFELGGHSLLAIQLISAIRRQLAVEVSIGDIFDYPTIESLAEKKDLSEFELVDI